jgi:PAS domain S-box-containing protein
LVAVNRRLQGEIAEHQRVADALRESEARFRTVFESAARGMVVVDADGRFLQSNQAVQEMLGYTGDELQGMCMSEVTHSGDVEGAMALFTELKNGERNHYFYEKRDIRKDDGVVELQVAVSALPQVSGPFQALAMSQDITERKQAEESLGRLMGHLEDRVQQRTAELESANERLQSEIGERERAQAALAEHSEELVRSNTDLEQFAYAASHDLQEPLRAVAGLTSVLARRYKDTVADDPDSLVPRIVTAAARMQALVNDLWTYSRIGRGNDPLEPTDCDDVADRGIEDLQRSITDSGASVTHDPLPVVMGSAPLLSQVFGNLIGNSLKFRGEASPRVHVSAERQGDAWVFSVADNGLGIDPAYADRIFVVFQRLHTIDEYAGTGIGLAICKKAVERLCGRIWFESQPGQGTTFFFTLPAQGSSAPGC